MDEIKLLEKLRKEFDDTMSKAKRGTDSYKQARESRDEVLQKMFQKLYNNAT